RRPEVESSAVDVGAGRKRRGEPKMRRERKPDREPEVGVDRAVGGRQNPGERVRLGPLLRPQGDPAAWELDLPGRLAALDVIQDINTTETQADGVGIEQDTEQGMNPETT